MISCCHATDQDTVALFESFFSPAPHLLTIAVPMCYCRHALETCKEQGVHAKMDLWLATIHVGKKQAYLGTYASKQEAGVVWDAASIWRSMKAPGKHA